VRENETRTPHAETPPALTEIYLCNVCSGPEIYTAVPAWPLVTIAPRAGCGKQRWWRLVLVDLVAEPGARCLLGRRA
jgi:hypothetical protein